MKTSIMMSGVATCMHAKDIYFCPYTPIHCTIETIYMEQPPSVELTFL